MIVIKRPFVWMLAAALLGEVIASLGIGMLVFLILVPIILLIWKNTTRRSFFVVFFLLALMGYLVTYNAIVVRTRVWNSDKTIVTSQFRVGKITDATSGYNVILEKRNERYLYREKEEPNYKIGQVLIVKGKVKQFEVARNYGNFSSRDYYMSMGVYAEMDGEVIGVASAEYDGIRQMLYDMGKYLKALLAAISNDTSVSKGSVNERKNTIYQAILLGDKTEIDTEVKDLYSASGIAHILAISGLHISFIGMFIYHILRKKSGFVVAGSVSFFVVVLFAIMAGMGMATIRALIMFGLKLLGEMLGRVYDALTAISIAGLALLLWNPFVIYHQGFLMSFVAIYGISYIWPKVEYILGIVKSKDPEVREEKSVTTKERVRRVLITIRENIVRAIIFSVHVTIFMAPLIACFYYEIPTFSFLLNIIVVPLMSVVIFSGLGGVIIAGVLPLNTGSIVLLPGSVVLEMYRMMCTITQKLPGSRIVVGKVDAVHVAVYYVALSIVICVLRQVKKKKMRLLEQARRVVGESGKTALELKQEKMAEKKTRAKYAVVLLMCASFFYASLYAQKLVKNMWAEPIETCFCDVGQGDGICMRLKKGIGSRVTVCVDGGSTTVKNVGKYRIVPYLKASGIGEIDYQFVTHGDEDHLSGVREILENNYMHIRNLILPYIKSGDKTLEELRSLATSRGTHVYEIKRGEGLQIDEIKVKCLHPYVGLETEDKNDYSIVLSVIYQNFSMLLTGDLTSEQEPDLIKTISQPYTVLKVGHHGSKYSTSQELLEVVKPKIGVLSSGKGNRYGHPTPEVMQRLTKVGCEYIRTDQVGGISISSDGLSLEVAKRIGH